MSAEKSRFDASFIQSGDAERLIAAAEQTARKTSELNPTQIRRLYGPVVRMRMRAKPNWDFNDKVRAELLLLKPKLAYTAARKEKAGPLTEALEACIDQVRSGEHLKNFCNFFEAYVGYHKGHE